MNARRPNPASGVDRTDDTALQSFVDPMADAVVDRLTDVIAVLASVAFDARRPRAAQRARDPRRRRSGPRRSGCRGSRAIET